MRILFYILLFLLTIPVMAKDYDHVCSTCYSKGTSFVSNLNLEPVAEAGALKLKEAFPHIRFTSGRRTVRDQARAMSHNVVLNRKWIEQTYRVTDVSIALQKFVDEHPELKRAKELENGFVTVLESFSDEQVLDFSKHLSGMAFDIKPTWRDAKEIKEMVLTLEGLDKFIDREGGLVRWHVQF